MAPKAEARYDTLMRVRQRQEEMKAAALAEILRAIQVTEQQRDEIARQQRQIIEQARQATQREFRAASVEDFYRYERHLARLAVEKDARIVELRAAELVRRKELETAYKSRRMVEKLNDREQAAYSAHVNKKEQAALDETATNHAAMANGRNGDGIC